MIYNSRHFPTIFTNPKKLEQNPKKMQKKISPYIYNFELNLQNSSPFISETVLNFDSAKLGFVRGVKGSIGAKFHASTPARLMVIWRLQCY